VRAQYAVDLALPWVLIPTLKTGAEVGEFDFSDACIAFEFLKFRNPTGGNEFFAQVRADVIQCFATGRTWAVGKDFFCERKGIVFEMARRIGFSKKPKRDNCGGKEQG
jgi:hypothetical protein